MDKASVLGDAIKYVKTLEEKLKTLEEKLPKKRMRSLSSKKSSGVSPAATNSASTGGSQGSKPASTKQHDEVVDEDDGSQPEIEARKIDKNLLIRMHCEKRKSLLVKSLAELEKMKLVVLNANMLSFSANTVDFTCCAQVPKSCSFSSHPSPPFLPCSVSICLVSVSTLLFVLWGGEADDGRDGDQYRRDSENFARPVLYAGRLSVWIPRQGSISKDFFH